VKIPRLGSALSAAVLLAIAAPLAAQDVRPEGNTYTVKRGDTLWDIAAAYLGDAFLWPEIYRLNTDQIDDPHWIYPGEILRLPVQAVPVATVPQTGQPGVPPAPVVEQPRRNNEPTIFASRAAAGRRLGSSTAPVVPPRVALGDVVSAPYLESEKGPRATGRIMFGADIPGIDRPRSTSNFQLYDRLLMIVPPGSVAAERDRFVAYTRGPDQEGIGMVVVPSGLVEVVRAPRNNEPAVVQVVELYTQLNADDKVVPLDTLGAGATGTPTRIPANAMRTSKILAIHRPAVLPSLDYFILSDLSSRDGLKIGDEVQIFRPREEPKGDDGPVLPEVQIATAQVVRVTRFGMTARITSQAQPAIRQGESIRVTARMP
jgi:LysM repeat protein